MDNVQLNQIALHIFKTINQLTDIEAILLDQNSLCICTQQIERISFDLFDAGEGNRFGLVPDGERRYKLYIPLSFENNPVLNIVNFLSCMSFGSHDRSDFGQGIYHQITKINPEPTLAGTFSPAKESLVLALLVENLKDITLRVNQCLDLINPESVRRITWGAVKDWTGSCPSYAIWR